MTGPRPGTRLLIDLPGGLAAVRLDAAAEPLDRQARRLLDQLGGAGPPVGGIEQTTSAVTAALTRLGALNVQLIGKFAVPTADGPATATVVLAVHPLPVRDREAAAANRTGLAAAVREIVQRRHPAAETRVVPLAIGPAAAGVWFGELRLPPERTGTEQEVIVPTYRVQFLIPLPTPLPAAGQLVTLDVSTVSAPGWPAVARQAVSIANSVRFGHAG
jgi:hypothetical protein